MRFIGRRQYGFRTIANSLVVLAVLGSVGCGDKSPTGTDAPASPVDAPGIDAVQPGDLCSEFCSRETACSQSPLPTTACIAECERTRGFFDPTMFGPPCLKAIDQVFRCMADTSCATWPTAANTGECADEMRAQDTECAGAGYFPGWDTIVLQCQHAITECRVDVPQVSTWLDYESCWGESKLRALESWEFMCSAEYIALQKCQTELPCAQLQGWLRGENRDCAAAATALTNCFE